MTDAEHGPLAAWIATEADILREDHLRVETDGPDDDPAEVEAAWATEIGRRLQDTVDGTTVGVPDSEVRQRFGL